MQPTTQTKAHWSSTDSSLWYRWRGYTVRWALFGIIVQISQSVTEDVDPYWLQKFFQALFGLFFGVVCALVFTLAENMYNALRVRWKSWAIVVATWLVVKLVFVTVLAMAGGSQNY